jgi:hypothetical protein
MTVAGEPQFKAIITERDLRLISWEVLRANTADGGFVFHVQGRWPNGNHAMFLAIPFEVIPDD